MRSDLVKAKENKEDEFVTLYDDIASELVHYKSQLKGKKIICPCDWDASYGEKLIYKKNSISKKIKSIHC